MIALPDSTPRFTAVLNPELNEALEQRLLQIWVEVTNAGGAVGLVPPVEIGDVRVVADRVFGHVRQGDDHLVVGYLDGEPVGFLFLEQRPGPLFRHWATIKRLQVHPDLQGRGVGAMLLRETEKMSRDDLRLEQLHLTVRGGTGTEGFYESHGYELAARFPGLIRVAEGVDRDELYLIKHL